MEKRRALQPDVHERRLHAGQDAGDATEKDVADVALFLVPFDDDRLQDAALDHRDAGLVGGHVDEELFSHG